MTDDRISPCGWPVGPCEWTDPPQPPADLPDYLDCLERSNRLRGLSYRPARDIETPRRTTENVRNIPEDTK